MRKRSTGFAFCFGLLMVGAVFSYGGQAPVQPTQPETPKPATGPATPSSLSAAGGAIGAAVDPNKYVIGVEDVIHIRTWREPDFTFGIAVRPDGKITIPLVGDVQAANLTPLDLTADLKTKIGKYINNPDITVTVLEVRSKKYYIDGEVNRPGTFFLVGPITVLEALSNAGGFKEFANLKRIRILRGAKSYRFNYKEVSNGKRLEQNIQVQNADHIIVQ